MSDESLRFGTSLQLWYDLVRDGEDRVRTRLPEMIESYLAFVLQRHQADAAIGKHVMALDWLGGQELAGRERADAMRDVGDRCLLIAGMFPRLAERRNLQPDYYAALGRSAYAEVASATRAGYGELFAMLAEAFDAMLRVLGGLRPEPRLHVAPALVTSADWDAFAHIAGGRRH
ncbi:MAG: hypothetical protein M3Q11_06330 [Pseudomonadota bacterium]|nr:hypothetical protein [Pseudomonadota bacterium]